MGTFFFSRDSVDFDFTRNDTLFLGRAAWDLEVEKVREGFFRVNAYTLTIGEQFLFKVDFEDSTRNSEKNATNAVFYQAPTSPGFGIFLEMTLEKR